jgi:hypothetical protein
LTIAFDQQHAKLGLEFPQSGAQRRLGDKAGRSRAREIAMLGKGGQIVQLPERG